MSDPVDKEKLAQMCYFTTIRPKTDIKDECTERDNVVYWKTKRKINDDLQCN